MPVYYMHYILLQNITCITCFTLYYMHYILLQNITCITCLHCITCYYIYYITLHYITSYYTGGLPGAGLARLPPAQPQRPHIPQPAAPSGDPSMLISKLCAALQAGPEAYNKAQYRANQLVAAAGVRDTKCAVAGLVWVSDSSFGGKNTSWHGVYGAYKARNLSEYM